MAGLSASKASRVARVSWFIRVALRESTARFQRYFFLTRLTDGGGRAEDFDAAEAERLDLFAGRALELHGAAFGLQRVFGFDHEVGHTAEGRIARAAPMLDLLREEAEVVVGSGGLHGVVLGAIGLHDDFAGAVSAARASGHLGEQLKRLLRRTEVGQAQAGVGIDDAHEGNAGIVVSLGEHLRADEDVDVALGEAPEDLRVTALAGGGVRVHALDARLGERVHQVFLGFLRAGAEIDERIEVAVVADLRHFFQRVAVVAAHFVVVLMERERDVAVLAFVHPAALRAEDEGREAAGG